MATYDHDTLEQVYSVPTYEVYDTKDLDVNSKLSKSIFKSVLVSFTTGITGLVSRLLGFSPIGIFSICCLLPIFLSY